MTWARTILTDLATDLAATGHAQWDPAGVYAGLTHGIFIQYVPPTPDAILTLDLVVLNSNPTMSHVLVGLVLRSRSGNNTPLSAGGLLDELHGYMHGNTNLTLGGHPVPLVWHQSELNLGRDTNGRDEHTATYHAWAVRASTHAND